MDGGMDGGMDATFYANVADWRHAPAYSVRERFAAEYAEGIALDHIALRGDDAFWARMRQHFSDAEIVDLALCCTLWLGAGRTMRVLDVGQTREPTLTRRTEAA